MVTAKRIIPLVVAVAIVLALGSGIYLRVRGEPEPPEGQGAASGNVPTPEAAAAAFPTDVANPVEGAEVVLDTLVLSVTGEGQAAADRQAPMLAQVAGRVLEVRVRENDVVGPGALLVVIDPTEYQLAVTQAEARLQSAEATYRELTLFDDRMIADPAIRAERERSARARSGLAAAEVDLERARIELERTRVKAPFGGRVANVKVVPGQWVRVGDELVTVIDTDPIKIEVQVLEGDVGYLAVGRRARISLTAFPGREFTGRIETVNPLVDRQTRMAKVTVSVDNPRGEILPGMWARVALEARRFPDRLLVPRSAVLERDGRTMVFVLKGDPKGGTAEWRYICPGLENESLVEILPADQCEEQQSLVPGEIVLTDGHYTLIHDAPVRIVEDVREAGGRPR
ncbi:MAG TPA: efflux RND transporter periplasmic adaptor subunit [Longimicrobiales bacterium]